MILRPLLHREYVGAGPQRELRMPGTRARDCQQAFRKPPADAEYLLSNLRVQNFEQAHSETWGNGEVCPTAASFSGSRQPGGEGSGSFGRRRCLAVGDETGRVGLLTSGEESQGARSPWSVSSDWVAHRSGIYDLTWLDNERLITASGDRTLRLWDAETGDYISTFGCHPGTVRTVRPFNQNPNLFVSGCRGGLVLIWDPRAKRNPTARGPSGELCLTAEAEYDDLHCAAPKRRSGYRQPMAISCVLPTRDDRLLATASVHGEIKFWDIRVVGRKQDPVQEIPTAPFVHGMQRRPGITSLDFDPCGSKLLVSYRDSDIVVYEWMHYNSKIRSTEHFRTFTGSASAPYSCSSFYVHSCFSPDGNYVLSGSSVAHDQSALIWDVYGSSSLPTKALFGHTDEVTTVHWDPHNMNTIASISDDASVRIWEINESRFHNRASRVEPELSVAARRGRVYPGNDHDVRTSLSSSGTSFGGHASAMPGRKNLLNNGMRLWTPNPQQQPSRRRLKIHLKTPKQLKRNTGEGVADDVTDDATELSTPHKRKAVTLLDFWQPLQTSSKRPTVKQQKVAKEDKENNDCN